MESGHNFLLSARKTMQQAAPKRCICISHDQGCIAPHAPRSEEKETKRGESDKMVVKDVHLALKVLHYIQKVVVHVRFIMELHLDRVQVAQRVRHIQRPIIVAAVALSRVGGRSGRSSVAAAVLYRYRVRLDRRCARAGMHGRAGERVVRTQPGRWWWGLRRLH
jgi:hypothetical protein